MIGNIFRLAMKTGGDGNALRFRQRQGGAPQGEGDDNMHHVRAKNRGFQYGLHRLCQSYAVFLDVSVKNSEVIGGDDKKSRLPLPTFIGTDNTDGVAFLPHTADEIHGRYGRTVVFLS